MKTLSNFIKALELANENGLGLELNEIDLATTDLEEKYDEILDFLYECLDAEYFDISDQPAQIKNDLQFTLPSGKYYHSSGEFFYNKESDKYEEKVQDVDGKVYSVAW